MFNYFSRINSTMKKIHYLFIACFILVAACKKANDNTNCTIPSFTFSLADKQVGVTVNDYDAQNGFDIEYGPAGFTQGSGTTASFTGTSSTFTVTAYGNYDVYLRKKCTSGTSAWSSKGTVNVDGSSSSCQAPGSLAVQSYNPPQFEWYGWNGNFYDVEYGPTGFTIGNGTRIRTNSQNNSDAIMHSGITYDFYVRSNCGGNAFSSWSGPHSYYAAQDYNISVPCTAPTNLYAYQVNTQEINYSAQGHGSVSYEIAFSTSGSVNNGNILSTSSPNGTVGNPGGFNGTYYFWVRGKCDNNSFTSWVVSQVQ